ncbi:abortive infection family protein [Proteinivorax hydrogeniformans]|uniref:Abortive infection family protein n=1 Tax=Proteinivorax hydrogeniformans TaxID=1826727 RepID=A0AAU8HRQ3_9FIRM
MLEDIVNILNKYLKYDGYAIIKVGHFNKVKNLTLGTVETSNKIDRLSHEFINEQLKKCDTKLLCEDFDGAITNSRSLVEAVFIELEKKLESDPLEYDGDLNKLYKRVKKLLNLEPNRIDIDSSLKQVLGGLNSIVVGLGGIRNKMSDSHARTYKPYRHHALLVVNSAKTVASFVLDTYEYQKGKGIIK